MRRRIFRWTVRLTAAALTALLSAAGAAAQLRSPGPWDISWLPPEHVMRDPIVREAAIRAFNQAINKLPSQSLRRALSDRGGVFLSAAYEFGVNPAFVLSIMRFENRTAGSNFGAITCPGGRPVYGAESCRGRFAVFSDPDAGIRAVFWYLAQDPNVQGCRRESRIPQGA